MTHGSLFSGIGGFDLAAEWAGWENAFHCEWNEFGKRVLKYYWPNAISYGDITKTDFTIWRGRIDVLSGGFPCQPYSVAGKRLGKEDERHLWPEMLRAIREIQPRWVVGENVPGLISWNEGLVFNEVQADLEAEGYEIIPFILPACGVNAPHRRDRVWFVAFKDANSNGWRGEFGKEKTSLGQLGNTCTGNNERLCSDNGETATAPNTTSERLDNREQNGRWADSTEIRAGLELRSERPCSNKIAPNNESKRQSSQYEDRAAIFSTQTKSGLYGRGSNSINNPTDWENFPTQPPVCSGNDGFPTELDGLTLSKWRNESLKAYGNAIVPQVAYQIFKAINQYEELQKQNK